MMPLNTVKSAAIAKTIDNTSKVTRKADANQNQVNHKSLSTGLQISTASLGQSSDSKKFFIDESLLGSGMVIRPFTVKFV